MVVPIRSTIQILVPFPRGVPPVDHGGRFLGGINTTPDGIIKPPGRGRMAIVAQNDATALGPRGPPVGLARFLNYVTYHEQCLKCVETKQSNQLFFKPREGGRGSRRTQKYRSKNMALDVLEKFSWSITKRV